MTHANYMYIRTTYYGRTFQMKLLNHYIHYMYCIERTSVLQESCYVAISDDISAHADFQVDGYHGC